jgi:hypothetical protein
LASEAGQKTTFCSYRRFLRKKERNGEAFFCREKERYPKASLAIPKNLQFFWINVVFVLFSKKKGQEGTAFLCAYVHKIKRSINVISKRKKIKKKTISLFINCLFINLITNNTFDILVDNFHKKLTKIRLFFIF